MPPLSESLIARQIGREAYLERLSARAILGRPVDIDAATRAIQDQVREPATPYDTGERSWFMDLAAAAWTRQFLSAQVDNPAWRNVTQAPPFIVGRIEIDPKMARARIDRAKRAVEQRAVTTSDPGAAALMPAMMPASIAARFVATTKTKAAFTGILRHDPMPDHGMTISAAKITTGAITGLQVSELDEVPSQDLDMEAKSTPVITLAGYVDVSVQGLDRSGGALDAAIAQELGAALGEVLEDHVINGVGASGQLLGLRAVDGITTVSYTDASPTQGELLTKILSARSSVATALGHVPTHVVMHPRRASWLAAGMSSTPPMFTTGQPVDGGPLAGMNVVESLGIPTNLGTGTDEDVVFVLNPQSVPIMLGTPHVEPFVEFKGDTLTVRFRVRQYAALLAHLRPEALGVVIGTGLTTPVM